MPRNTNETFSANEAAYGFRAAREGERAVFKWSCENHTPFYSLRDNSRALLQVEMNGPSDAPWLGIRLEEQTPRKDGTLVSRVISVTLGTEARAALLEYLKQGEGA